LYKEKKVKKLKKGDEVIVITGKDKGAKSKILKVISSKNKLLLEKVNIVKKHQKPSQNNYGGIVEIEKPINLSNVMYYCKLCNKATRIKIQKVDTKLYRRCLKCNEIIDK
jgi:large subunit ribosomal protein L24